MPSTKLKTIMLATSMLAGGTGAVFAQDQGQQIEQVVVTGSLIARPGFTSPTPVTTLTAQDLDQRAPANISELQVDIPALRPNQNVNNNASGAGQSNLDLRALGPSRTLLLLDGRRLPPTNPNGTTDITLIPTILVNRIDVVTGGASAAYGSDAVSGVVNVLLDNKLDGFKATLQGGQANAGDLHNYETAAAYGMSFGPGDKGHIVAALDWFENLGADKTGRRYWGNSQTGIITNPAYVAGSNNGQTRLEILSGTTHSRMTLGGVIIANAGTPLYGIQFGPGGTVLPFHYGTYIGTTYQEGGDGTSFSRNVDIFPRVGRRSAYGNVSYDLSSNITAYADVVYADTHELYLAIPNYNNGDATITINNAFLPASIKSIMTANKITSFVMGRANLDFNPVTVGRTIPQTLARTGRYAAGLKGSFGDGWAWQAYIQHEQNDYTQHYGDNRNEANWKKAINSQINPANGQPICVSTLTAPTDGCVPVNMFGPDTITQAVRDYALGTSWQIEHNSEEVVAFNISGEPVTLWAGPVSIASGAEYRRDSIIGTSDAISQALGWRSNNIQPLQGGTNVKEAFVETVVPLLKDVPWAQSLELNAAVRETEYSTSGDVTTWKIGLNYVPTDEVRFRGTLSHDIRAANLNELFTGRTQGTSVIIDRANNAQGNFNSIGGGNPSLVPEQANTDTVGAVYTPGWLPGLQASIDYYKIQIKGAIGAIGAQQVVDNCYAGLTTFCSQLTRDPVSGKLLSVSATQINFQQLQTDGVDIDTLYNFTLNDLFPDSAALSDAVPGRFSLHLVSTFVNNLVTLASGARTNTAGDITAGVPHWRVNLTLSYDADPLTMQALFRYVQGGNQSNTYVQGIDINQNRVSSRGYLDVSASYKLYDEVRLFAKIDNLLDVAPPLTPSMSVGNQQVTSVFFDMIGRAYTMGVRLRF